MGSKIDASAIGVTGPFIQEANVRGLRPPIRVVDQETRAWQVGARGGDALLLDEFGDLWWARVAPRGDARTIRPCWPEEARKLCDDVARALVALLQPSL